MPVVVSGIQLLSGGGKYVGVNKIKRVRINNRSPKTINSVQLRWMIASLDDREKVLSESTTQFAHIRVEANNSDVIEIPTLYPARMLKSLAKNGELYGEFMITLGIQEARFDDGSFWRRPEQGASLRFFYLDQSRDSPFPALASLAGGFIRPILNSSSSQSIFKPCETQPRSAASALF